MTPEWTRGALVLLISFWLLFFVVADHIRNLADVQRILKWIALAAVFMALIGLAQRFFGNGKFLWVYEHPTRNTLTAVNGAFTNQNHFAHFLALGIAPLILWIRSNLMNDDSKARSQKSQQFSPKSNSQLRDILLIAGLCLVVFAGLLSFSRGGVSIIFLTSCFAVIGFAKIGLLSLRSVMSVGIAGGVITIAVLIFGYQPLANEFHTIDQAHSLSELLPVRWELWTAMLSATMEFPLFGTGAGSHRHVYPAFCDHPAHIRFSHGESGYIQIAMETGLSGILILLSLISLLSVWLIQWFGRAENKPAKACMIATVAGLVASVTHSIVDFVWYIPACVTLTVVLMALACRIMQLNSFNRVEARSVEPRQSVVFAMSLGILFLCGLLVHQRIGPGVASYSWDRYFAISKHAETEERIGINENDSPERAQIVSEFRLREMKRYLLDTIRWDPTHSDAMLRLASLDLRQFEQQQSQLFSSMPLDQIVDVAQSSNFDSDAERDAWIHHVLGNRTKLLRRASILSEQTLRLSPLEGRAYILLAESGQLFGWVDDRRVALFEQAKKVRPFDELVQYNSAIERIRLGDIEGALIDWKRAFAKSPAIRSRAIRSLVPIYSVQLLTELLQDDWETLFQLYIHYKTNNRDEDARFVARPLAKNIESDAEFKSSHVAAQLLSRAGHIFAYLGQYDDSVRCLRKSSHLSPSNFQYHLSLAEKLMKTEKFDEAVTEYKWCRRRQPKNSSVSTLLEQAYKMSLNKNQPEASPTDRIGESTKQHADISIQR